MARRRQKTNLHRAKTFLSVIRKIRGKPLLEALHRLQNGHCAYDTKPCLLLLPQAIDLYSSPTELKRHRQRFATIDHVQPRFLGGTNHCTNLVMASQLCNHQKGCAPPLLSWTPHVTHAEADVVEMLKIIEQTRWLVALKFAEDRKLNKQDVIDHLVRRELRRLQTTSNFKFYDDYPAMVA